MNRNAIIGIVVLLLLSGCNGPAGGNTYWELGFDGESKKIDDGFAVDGEVGLSGNYGPVEVKNVRILFLYDNKSIIKAVSIGTLDESRHVESFNVTVATAPEYVILETGSISSPANMEYHIFPGLKRTTDGKYVELNDRVTAKATA